MSINEEFYKTNVIYKSWVDNPFKFVEPTEANDNRGLRRPQIAALYTALGYLASSHEKPATIVMPTGTGKTDTIFSLIIAGHFQRTLIIVPSDALREQTSEKIAELRMLRDIGAIDEDTVPPKIFKISSKLELAELEKAQDCNVIIATPQAISLFNEDELGFLANLCSHLIVDEAHHVAARTWRRVKKAFNHKACIQFTATPFREDGESLEGSIIYNYPLREAQNDKYFQEIEFHPIREYQPSAADRSIAEKAIELLRKDLADGKDHLMMVRVKSQKRAEDLFRIYKEHEDLNPVLIHSKTKGKKNILESIKGKKHKVIVCVNMLGEGFDLPELKIAAIHDQHCTPAVTLQFIGRLTRANKKLGTAKFVANIANQKMDAQMSALYEENADWSAVIREVSEKKIKRELQKQELTEKFVSEEGERILSLNPTPNISATAYVVGKDDWVPSNIHNYQSSLEKVEFVTVSDTQDVVIMVTRSETSVGWANTAEIKNTEWFLYIAYYSEKERTLFVNSSGDEGQTAKFRKYLAKDFMKIDGERTFRTLDNIDFLRLQNVGLSRSNKDLRFTMHVGRDISAIINDLETGTAIKSNVFAAGYESGEKTTAGCSYKGKFWEMNSESIDYWIKWCDHAGKKLNNPNIDTKNIIKNAMQAEPIHGKWPAGIFYADWPDEISIESERKIFISFNGESHNLIDLELGTPYLVSDTIIQVPLIKPNLNAKDKILDIRILLLEDGCKIDCPGKISLQKERALSDYLNDNPLRLLKQDGSFIRGNYRYFSAKTLNVKIPMALVEGWDWGDTPLNKESMGPERNLKSVQGFTYLKIEDRYQLIFNDDDAGEIADLVAVNETEDQIIVDFYHCKYCPSKSSPGGRVEDTYVISGQASRSVKWVNRGEELFEQLMYRYQVAIDKNFDRVLKGDISNVDLLRRKCRDKELVMGFYIVQPAIKESKISEDQLTVLGTSYTYVKGIAGKDIRVIVSK